MTLRLRQDHDNALPTISEPAADGSFWAADIEEFEKGQWFVHHFTGDAQSSACGRYRANAELLEDVPRYVPLGTPALICAGCLRRIRRSK